LLAFWDDTVGRAIKIVETGCRAGSLSRQLCLAE